MKWNCSEILDGQVPGSKRLFRLRRSRSAAAYSDQTLAWTICRSVCPCVGLSSALSKNGGSDLDAIWHHKSDGSRDEAGSGVWGSVHGNGYFWGKFGGAIVTNGDFTVYVCDHATTRPVPKLLWTDLLIYFYHWSTVESSSKKLLE